MGQIIFRKLPDEPFTGPAIFGAARLPSREVGAAEPGEVASPHAPASPGAPAPAGDPCAKACRSQAGELYRQYGAIVYRRCLRLLKHPEAARDATQEVFVRLVQHMDRLEDRETIVPWMFRVATNHCLNQLRGNRIRREEDGEGVLDVEASSSAEVSPDRALARALLSRFDAGTQAMAVGILVDEMEYEEVAQMLGVSRRTVARKVERFLRNARRLADGKLDRRGAAVR
jgi:RNA polymerase sigma-70 factor, ECF subfamily